MKLEAELNLASLKITRENTGPGVGPLLAKLGLDGKLRRAHVAGLFSTPEAAAAVVDSLYRPGPEGALVTSDLAEIDLEREGTGIRATLGSPIALSKVITFDEAAKLDQLQLVPRDGGIVELSARLTVRCAGYLEQLGEWLGQTVRVSIEAKQSELALGAPSGDDTRDPADGADQPADAPATIDASLAAADEAGSGKVAARKIGPNRKAGARQVPKGQDVAPGIPEAAGEPVAAEAQGAGAIQAMQAAEAATGTAGAAPASSPEDEPWNA